MPNPFTPYSRWLTRVQQALEIREIDYTNPSLSADIAVVMWNKLPEKIRTLAPQHSYLELVEHLKSYDLGVDRHAELFQIHYQERLALLFAEKMQIAEEAYSSQNAEQLRVLAWSACFNQFNTTQKQYAHLMGIQGAPTTEQLQQLDRAFGPNFLGPKPSQKGSNNQDSSSPKSNKKHKGSSEQKQTSQPQVEYKPVQQSPGNQQPWRPAPDNQQRPYTPRPAGYTNNPPRPQGPGHFQPKQFGRPPDFRPSFGFQQRTQGIEAQPASASGVQTEQPECQNEEQFQYPEDNFQQPLEEIPLTPESGNG